MADEKLHETDEDQKDWQAEVDGETQASESENAENTAEGAQSENADAADATDTDTADVASENDGDSTDSVETEETEETVETMKSESAEDESEEDSAEADSTDAENNDSKKKKKKRFGFFKRRKNKKNKKKEAADDTADDDDYSIPIDKVEAVLNATADETALTPQMQRMMKRQAENTKRVEESIKGTKSNPRWFVPLFCILMIIGLVWAVIYYLTSDYPIPDIGAWNLLIAFVIIMVGFIMTMWWR